MKKLLLTITLLLASSYAPLIAGTYHYNPTTQEVKREPPISIGWRSFFMPPLIAVTAGCISSFCGFMTPEENKKSMKINNFWGFYIIILLVSLCLYYYFFKSLNKSAKGESIASDKYLLYVIMNSIYITGIAFVDLKYDNETLGLLKVILNVSTFFVPYFLFTHFWETTQPQGPIAKLKNKIAALASQ